jgi:hypothetical protein
MINLYSEITAGTPGRFLCVSSKSEKHNCTRKLLYFIATETVSKFVADHPAVPYSTGHWEEITPTDEERAKEIATSIGDSLLGFESLTFDVVLPMFTKAPEANRQGHNSPRTGYTYVIEITR